MGASVPLPDQTTGFDVTIRYSDGVERAVSVLPGQTVLAAAELQGVPIVSECRSGICGACVGHCASGSYELGNAEALSDPEKSERSVLTCQTLVRSNCVVELDYAIDDNAARLACGDAVVRSVECISDTTAILALDASSMETPLDFKPGQYAQLQVPGSEQWRSYSYAHLPHPSNHLTFLIRLLPQGVMSDYLRSGAKPGDTIGIRGSKGSFYLRPVKRPLVLMAGGTGLSAILAILEQLVTQGVGVPVRLYYGVTGYGDLCKLDQLKQYSERLTDFQMYLSVVRPSVEWSGHTGVITDQLEKSSLFDGDADVYLCGPPAMVDATRQWLREHDLQRAQVFYEKFVASGAEMLDAVPRLDPQQIDYEQLRMQGRRTAVVMGGSIAGICTAKVLTEQFDRVIVLEQDPEHSREEGRPGAAQGWHLHHLLIAAQKALEEIFPGISDDMVREGAFRVDTAHQYRILMAGSWKKVFRSGLEIICAGRPLMEWCIRRRLDGEEKLDYRYDSKVAELLYDRGGNRVLGVAVTVQGQLEIIPAEFVVDASGKNTPVPQLLESLGVGAPEVDQDCINAVYSSMQHKVPPERRWKDKVMVICYAYRPHQKHYTAQYYTDSTRSVLSTSLIAYDSFTPPRTVKEFNELAKKMPSDAIAKELEGLEPCSEIHSFRYPSMLRRKYEDMKGLPGGLIVIGDAYSSADPVSGAGIPKALMELNELRDLLRHYCADSEQLVQKYYQRISKISDSVWFVVREQNLRYPWIKDVEKKRPFYFGFLNWYMDRLIELSHSDVAVYKRLLSVTHFVAKPTSLLSPQLFTRAIGKWLGTKMLLRETLIEKNFSHGKLTSSEPMPGEPLNVDA